MEERGKEGGYPQSANGNQCQIIQGRNIHRTGYADAYTSRTGGIHGNRTLLFKIKKNLAIWKRNVERKEQDEESIVEPARRVASLWPYTEEEEELLETKPYSGKVKKWLMPDKVAEIEREWQKGEANNEAMKNWGCFEVQRERRHGREFHAKWAERHVTAFEAFPDQEETYILWKPEETRIRTEGYQRTRVFDQSAYLRVKSIVTVELKRNQ
ncbi:hypothetical protein PM082_016384 [Marasmius tenuissimus]|nr:hypothetical protein PM082_016384 [Marasmius tenuissimus]